MGTVAKGSATTRGASWRTLVILRCIASGPDEFTLKDVAARAGLPPSTVHRLLDPWVRMDLLEHTEPRSYRVGPELFRLASLVDQKLEIKRVARPLLSGLWKEWQETSVLCLFHPSTLSAAVVDSIASPHPLKYVLPAYSTVSLAWGSLGRAILAHLSIAQVEAVLDQNERGPLSNRSLPPRKAVLKELALIRARRYALYYDLAIDVAGVSAPVLQRDGRIVGSLGVIMPASRFGRSVQTRLPAAIRDCAVKLSSALIG